MFPSRRATLGGGVFRDEFSVSFDGTDEFIDLGSQDGDLRLSGSNGAIIAWIKPTLTGDDFQRIVDKSDGGNGSNGYALFINNGNVTGNINGSETVTSPFGVLVADKWQQITWTWDGTNHSIYVNGKLILSSTDSRRPPSNTTNMRIGTWNHDTGREYQGSMSEIAIYNKGLSASEVKTIYNGREPYNHKEGVCSNNLVAWYRMGDGVLDNFNLIADQTNATLGSNIITNGTFDTDSDWANSVEGNTAWTIANGVATRDGSTTNSGIVQESVFSNGLTYKVKLTISNRTTGALIVYAGQGSQNIMSSSSNGTITGYVTATANRKLLLNGTSNFDGSVDNVTVRQVGGNAGIMKNMSIDNFEGDTP